MAKKNINKVEDSFSLNNDVNYDKIKDIVNQVINEKEIKRNQSFIKRDQK